MGESLLYQEPCLAILERAFNLLCISQKTIAICSQFLDTAPMLTPDRIIRIQERISNLLEPLGRAYAALMRHRAQLYRNERLPVWYPPVPCISVGNISWGGTGKTPVASWLLDWAQEKKLHPAVLTRGYGGNPPRLPYPVKMSDLANKAGDEPLLLKRAHPQAEIIVDPNRVRGGKMACTQLGVNMLILDDGFQHLRVNRNLNLCLLAPRDLEEDWDRVIPAGSWREDLSALTRADAFLVNTMFDEEGCLETVAQIRLGILDKPLFFFQVSARGITNPLTGKTLDSLEKVRFILVTGIANPDKVCRTCRTYLGEQPVRHLVYPDHHPFRAKDWKDIVKIAMSMRCEHILCTPKDAIKLAAFADERLWVPQLTTSFYARGLQPFPVWLEEQLGPLTSSKNIHEKDNP